MNNEIRVAPAEKLERKSGLSGQSSLELSGVNFERFIKSATTPNESVSLDSLIKDQVVVKQIEPKIIEMAEFLKSNEEKQLIKLRLKPTELGEVEIRIERDSVGNIRAHFHTTSETTRHILSESLGQLRDSLQNSGLKVESLEVSSNPQPSAGNEKGDQQSRHGERFERVGNDATFSNIENEDESQEDPAQRLVNLRA
jgi:flagellar hook-length control protein FliK